MTRFDRHSARAVDTARVALKKMAAMLGELARLTDVRTAVRGREQVGRSYGARR
jgi:hypothetical protein